MNLESNDVSPQRRALGPLIGGLILIALGLALFFDTINLWEFEDVFRFWPLALVGLGLSKLISPQKDDDRRGGLWLVGIGAWLLVPSLRLFDLGWEDSWPLILIVIGLLIIIQSLLIDRRLGANS
ncbi:MAG TPA: DUF5668 domain-containing protein [Acidobacteriota bacterium]|nr:DUF5668 domain-containing protein [Acidobacteriota bacterium]